MLLVCFSLQYYFTVLFGHEGQKPLELRCEEQQDGKEWMEAIHQARYGLSPVCDAGWSGSFTGGITVGFPLTPPP